MPTFTSKPYRGSPLSRSLLRSVRRHPVLLFGAPFLVTIVGASFALSSLTQTRYELQDQKVSQVSKEDELRMNKNRKKVDIREEYFRLQANADELDEWENKRVPRPEGVPEWGLPGEGTTRD